MTSINRADIKVGDKIAITETLTVTAVDDNWSTDQTDIKYAEFPGRTFSLTDEAKVELLDRPLVLPTHSGSVIKVSSLSGLESATWMLTYDNRWVSDFGTTVNTNGLLHLIKQGHFNVRVVI